MVEARMAGIRVVGMIASGQVPGVARVPGLVRPALAVLAFERVAMVAVVAMVAAVMLIVVAVVVSAQVREIVMTEHGRGQVVVVARAMTAAKSQRARFAATTRPARPERSGPRPGGSLTQWRPPRHRRWPAARRRDDE